MPNLSIIDAIARTQYGLITSTQLLEAGFRPDGSRRLTDNGHLIRLRRGVYRLCGSPVCWRGTVLAAILAAGDGAVLSHRSAAALWSLVDRHDLPGGVEITSPTLHRLPGVVCHRHRLDADEVTSHERIPVTGPGRTLLDLAETADPVFVGEMIDAALRRGLTSMRRLTELAERRHRPGRRRTRGLMQALQERGVGFDPGANAWEMSMDRQWDRLGLPPAVRQYRIRIDGHSYRLDRAIPIRRIGVEWNGCAAHGTRSGFDHDTERRSRLVAAGWCVLEFTPRSTPAFVRETVLAVFAGRAHLQAAPPRPRSFLSASPPAAMVPAS